MESLIVATTHEKENILKRYHITDTEIKDDIQIIKTWKEKQPHLPKNISDDFIKNMLLMNKFRVEKTKQKLDNYYTLRGQHKDLFSGFENIVASKHTTTYLPMPKLTPNLERVIIIKLLKSSPEEFNMLDVAKLNLCMEELSLQYNYCDGVRYVCDFSGVSVKHLPRINPIVLGKFNTIIENAYPKRVVGAEFINFPSFATKIMTILKMVSPPKVYGRIRIHENMESLYELIPKEYLPVEYGGSFGNIPDLLKKWDKAIEDHRDFLVKNYKNVSAEHLRLAQSNCDESFGVKGTFKKLELD